jgi:branched-chain amino acid transport system permease protein
MIAREVLSNINPVYWQFWLGIILILAVLFARGGVMGSAALLMQRFRARLKRRGNQHAKLKTGTTDA